MEATKKVTGKMCIRDRPQVADLRLIACPGAEELTNLIDKHLVRWASEAGYQTNSFIIESACPRFQSGDAKGCLLYTSSYGRSGRYRPEGRPRRSGRWG